MTLPHTVLLCYINIEIIFANCSYNLYVRYSPFLFVIRLYNRSFMYHPTPPLDLWWKKCWTNLHFVSCRDFASYKYIPDWGDVGKVRQLCRPLLKFDWVSVICNFKSITSMITFSLVFSCSTMVTGVFVNGENYELFMDCFYWTWRLCLKI